MYNFSFAGAAISSDVGGNAAGIRWEGGKMVLVNDAFTNNQNGILGGAGSDGTTHEIDIDHCYFADNGSGSGNTHNIYIGAIDQFTITNSISTGAVVGHELKSRALSNTISNNLFYDGPTGTASYDIDLPDGGVDTVTNNVIEKGPQAQNNAMVHFGGEGLPYANSSLLVEGNTFENDLGGQAVGVLNQSGIPVTVQDNTFDNIAAGNVISGPGTVTGNVDANGNPIANSSNNDPVPGSTLTFSDNNPHSVTLTSSLQAVRGGGGLLTVFAQGGHVVAIGGSGGMVFTESATSGGNSITTAAGSTNTLTLTGEDTVVSQGTDTISTGAYDVDGQISGNATVNGGTAFDHWTVSGTARFIGNGGGPFVTMLAGSTVSVTGTLGSLNLQDIGGAVSVDATEGTHFSLSITGGSTSTVISGGAASITSAGGATINLGDGTTQLTSAGGDTIYAGAGADTVILSGNSTVHAGTGTLAIFGRDIGASTPATVYGNGGTYVFGGDTGNIIYNGGAKASTVQANLSNLTLNGGAGRLTVDGGLSEQINGGAGGLTYNAQGGSATITTAIGSTNTLQLGSNNTVQSWGNDSITGGTGNDTITVHGASTISGGTGNRFINLMGKDTLTGATGYDTVTVSRGAYVTVNADNDYIHETGATLAVNVAGAKAGSAGVFGGSAAVYASEANGLSISTDADNATSVNLSTGAATVNTLGADLIHGSSGTASINVASANVQIWGGSGSITVNESNYHATNMKFIAGAGTATIDVNNPTTDVVFGAGNTTVMAYAGGNTYEFNAGSGGGNDVISGFKVGQDQLRLEGGLTVASRTISNGSANLVLSDHTHLQLVGVTSLNGVLG